MIRALSNEPVNDRWLLTGLAGRGSSSTVYRAFDLVDERLVAIKSLGDRGSRAGRSRRARREFLGMASLRHPHLVETYEYAEARSGPLAAGTPFFTMELLESAALGASGPVEPRRLARAALGLLAALECVHGHGLIHGDVKPSNVLADARGPWEGRVKLADLGLARRAGASGHGSPGGTLHYAAPERIAGGPTDARSDLYSLGVVLYEAATGSLPFDEADPADALAWHLRGAHGREEESAALPPALSLVIGRLLRTRMEDRPRTAREAWEEIAEAAPEAVRDPGGSPEEGDGPLVGRLRERAVTLQWLAARETAGGFLEIAGPPGSGVSRLAREAAHAGRAAGLSVHVWECRPGDHPFAPFGRPLRELILRQCRDPDRRRPPTERQVLALLGGPALWSAPDRLVAHAGPPLADAIAAFLVAGSAERPLLLVFDDAERIDRGSALVLRALASSPRGAAAGLLVVAARHAPSAPPAAATEGYSRRGRATGPGDDRVTANSVTVGRDGTAGIERWHRRATRPHLTRSRSRSVRDLHRRRLAGTDEASGAASDVRAQVVLGALSGSQARRLVTTLPGIGRLTAREVDVLIRCSEGMPGRLARQARAMAGRQLALFPPLPEPRRLS